MMIKDHQGAVMMARTEQAQGSSADAKALADSIVTSQSAEITTDLKLLGYAWRPGSYGRRYERSTASRDDDTPVWRRRRCTFREVLISVGSGGR
jgi:hypothetical protein